jgi:plastocyanin
MRVRRLLLAAGAVLAMACSDSGNGGQEPGDGDPTPEGDVLVRNDFFNPTDFEVAPGGTVVWAWVSLGREHNVTFDDGPTSGNQASGTYERTFSTAGDYPYHCTIHGVSMSGVIHVVAAPAPGGGSGGGGGGGGGGNGNPYDPGEPGY